jgi:hypothetical protein
MTSNQLEKISTSFRGGCWVALESFENRVVVASGEDVVDVYTRAVNDGFDPLLVYNHGTSGNVGDNYPLAA